MKTKAKAKSKTKDAGRPTKYSPQILKKADEYISSCVDEYFDYHKTQGARSDTYERKIRVNLPTVEGLALHLDVHRDTLHQWSKDYPLFSDKLEKLKALQAQRLMSGGLSGDYNPTIAKLLLASTHGMTDRTDLTSDGEKLPVPLLANAVLNHDSNQQGAGAK